MTHIPHYMPLQKDEVFFKSIDRQIIRWYNHHKFLLKKLSIDADDIRQIVYIALLQTSKTHKNKEPELLIQILKKSLKYELNQVYRKACRRKDFRYTGMEFCQETFDEDFDDDDIILATGDTLRLTSQKVIDIWKLALLILDNRSYSILKDRVFEMLSLAAIGQKHNISHQAIKKNLIKSTRLLRDYIIENGVDWKRNFLAVIKN